MNIVDRDWMRQAACRGMDPEIFYPIGDRHRGRIATRAQKTRIQRALQVCETCLVVSECGCYAKEFNEQYGVWGGRLLDQRNDHRRKASLHAS